ncbi:response regulator transcription factor [Paenibacillus nasutitermitis]|uniref:DNA-binding response regulator n=1 Tax=Paenibacillus nasutitermitis TaxID=1652958 RepID=A0A917DN25_9BACL|nr:response regulator [Paenibacillus nasutitermitis]GGD50612.1 hypothetical protein GCM10010911_05200 [Paenibacillus nasutitermitis]
MHRLLIVDDEPAILDGLVRLFEQLTEPKLDVCKAYSSAEAIGIARKTKIDIVLSDIRMPGKTGLQMIDDIVFYWPDCRIIFLTGYSEFDYVYHAFQKNVENFILKTEDDSVVIATVQAAAAKLDSELHMRMLAEQAEKRTREMDELLKMETIRALLSGERISHSIHDWFPAVQDGETVDRSVLLIVGQVINYSPESGYGAKLDVLSVIRGLFDGLFPPWLRAESTVYDASTLVWLVRYYPGNARFGTVDGIVDWQGVAVYMRGVLEAVQNGCREQMGLHVSIAVSGPAVEEADIAELFREARHVISPSVAHEPSLVVIGTNWEGAEWLGGKHSAHDSQPFRHQLKQLEQTLAEADEEQAVSLCRELLAHLQQQMQTNPWTGTELYCEFALTYFARLGDLEGEDARRVPLRVQLLTLLQVPKDWNKAEEEWVRLSENICALQHSREYDREQKILARIHRFLDDNIGRHLSLAQIAEAVYFNPSYLSRYYKRVTGRNLFDYINLLKTDTACAMLRDNQLKIQDIAAKLGFESASYFTTFFRKMVGKGPQEYREEFHNNK